MQYSESNASGAWSVRCGRCAPFVRCPVSTINHFDTIFSAHVQKILLDLAPWGDREKRTLKQKKYEDTRKDSAFREEQVGNKSLRTTGSIQRPLPSTDLILPSGVAPCLVWTRGLIFNRGFPILYQGVLSRDFQRISAKSWATRLPASFPLPRSLKSKHKKINTPKNRPLRVQKSS